MRAESVHAALLVLIVGGLGLAVFAYLETIIPALQGACSFSVFFSCSKVDQSGHTTTLGIPDWALGVGGFVALLALDLPLYVTWRRDLLTGLVVVSGLGLALAIYLGTIELAVIHALCPVCFSTYVVDALVFVLSLWLYRSTRGDDSEDDPDAGQVTEPSTTPSSTA